MSDISRVLLARRRPFQPTEGAPDEIPSLRSFLVEQLLVWGETRHGVTEIIKLALDHGPWRTDPFKK